MSVNLGQLIATAGACAAMAGAGAAIWWPLSAKREKRREAVIKLGIQEIVTSAVAEVKVDMLARVDKSDLATEKRFDGVKADLKDLTEKVHVIEVANATQYGGNGGGMRQAINEQGQNIAELAGQFKQHIIEVGKGGTK